MVFTPIDQGNDIGKKVNVKCRQRGACQLQTTDRDKIQIKKLSSQDGAYLQFWELEATRSISSSPGWDASLSQGYPPQH